MASEERSEQLRRLVEMVRASRTYRAISPEVIAHIGTRALRHATTFKAALKATKTTLHQVAAVYLPGEMPYAQWLEELRQALHEPDLEAIRHVCLRAMSAHISTRERLPLLPQFYDRLLADLPPIGSVLDLACGLHPLALPWMPCFAGRPRYYAYDLYEDMVDFLNSVLGLLQITGRASVCDIVQEPPCEEVDLAFVLKALPCLEQVEKGASLRLLEALRARYILVSFPAHSLGGGRRGMASAYEARFHALLTDQRWHVERFEFPGELVFRLQK
jgi:16S rRNA (guanine(1405)-N(7))-methyltransferase